MWIDDLILTRMAEQIALWSWVPENTHVILGASNRADTEIHEEVCALDHVPVLKRYGGGGTVVLHPGCVVVGVGLWVKSPFQNQMYFQLLNQAIINGLALWNPACGVLSQNGISDICIGSKKIAGTSLFRSKHYLLYQASILVDPKLHLIERYLRHPSKEPNYRLNRSHSDFLTSLQEFLGETSSSVEVSQFLSSSLPTIIEGSLKDHLVPPQMEHFAALEARIKRPG
jgi:lipoate-protein ligase A